MAEPSAPAPPTNTPIPRRSRARRWVRWVLIALMTGVACLVGWKLAHRELKRVEGKLELAAAVADTERTDPDWRWEALNAVRRWRFEPVDAPVTTRRTIGFSPG